MSEPLLLDGDEHGNKLLARINDDGSATFVSVTRDPRRPPGCMYKSHYFATIKLNILEALVDSMKMIRAKRQS